MINASVTGSRLIVLSLIVVGCGQNRSPLNPGTTVEVAFEYTGPQLAPIPQETGCIHHSAPSAFILNTSWGTRGDLREVGTRTYSLRVHVPVGDSNWVSLQDWMLCREDPARTPWVTRGLHANGVELHRLVEPAAEIRALQFQLTRDGRVVP
jgi:hypothetical protein